MTSPADSGRAAPLAGDAAPEFAAVDTHGTPVRLSDLRGAPVVLVFIPFAFSGTCTGELYALQDNIAAFDDVGARLVVISCDSTFALRAWKRQGGFPFDLLSDFWPHGEIARAFGVFDEVHGFALRGTFLIDADGVVRWSVVNASGEARDVAELSGALALL